MRRDLWVGTGKPQVDIHEVLEPLGGSNLYTTLLVSVPRNFKCVSNLLTYNTLSEYQVVTNQFYPNYLSPYNLWERPFLGRDNPPDPRVSLGLPVIGSRIVQ
ncbi:MAG: hypothetical protein GY931_10120 [Maribacter sp.]|nr:hypothetical protein [Maribacter sp.]